MGEEIELGGIMDWLKESKRQRQDSNPGPPAQREVICFLWASRNAPQTFGVELPDDLVWQLCAWSGQGSPDLKEILFYFLKKGHLLYMQLNATIIGSFARIFFYQFMQKSEKSSPKPHA